MNLIKIENNGPEIIGTNYFDSEYAARGYCYLSINAGAFRLLIPPALESAIAEMKTGKMAVISIGPDARHGGREMAEIMFDDGTSDPYCLFLSMEQVDRKPAQGDSFRETVLTVYTEGLIKEIETPCGFRYVYKLPFLKPWRPYGTN